LLLVARLQLLPTTLPSPSTNTVAITLRRLLDDLLLFGIVVTAPCCTVPLCAVLHCAVDGAGPVVVAALDLVDCCISVFNRSQVCCRGCYGGLLAAKAVACSTANTACHDFDLAPPLLLLLSIAMLLLLPIDCYH